MKINLVFIEKLEYPYIFIYIYHFYVFYVVKQISWLILQNSHNTKCTYCGLFPEDKTTSKVLPPDGWINGQARTKWSKLSSWKKIISISDTVMWLLKNFVGSKFFLCLFQCKIKQYVVQSLPSLPISVVFLACLFWKMLLSSLLSVFLLYYRPI